MPRKAAIAVESTKDEETSAPARRSTRISSKPQSKPEPELEPKKRKAVAIDMKLKDEQDQDIVLGDLGSDIEDLKGVVIFCVPKADTPGCTTQACGFRDSYPDFSSTGFQVYCLSADKPAAQEKWKTKKSLPYPLLSDPKRELISALGVAQGGKTQRSHFVFSKEDDKLKLVDKRVPVKPADSPKLALEFIKGAESEDDEDDEEEAEEEA